MTDWIGGRRPVAGGARRRPRGTAPPHLGASAKPSPELRAITDAARRIAPADRPRARRSARPPRRLRRAPGRPARGGGAPLGRRSTRSLAHAATAGHDPFVLVLEHLQDPTNFGTLLRVGRGGRRRRRRLPGARRGAAERGRGEGQRRGQRAPAAGAPADDRRGDPRAEGGRPAARGRRPGGARIGLGERPRRARSRSSSAARDAACRAQTKRRCDLLVSFPMAGRVASLNASTAGALLLFEVVRQRL